jgi:hypothetical protein
MQHYVTICCFMLILVYAKAKNTKVNNVYLRLQQYCRIS